MKTHGDKTRIAERIRRRAAAIAAAKVASHPIVAENQDGVAIPTRPVAIPIAVPVPPPIMIAVPILRTILLRGSQCPESNYQQDSEHWQDARRSILP
jgi:hypothetical protein